ncbi:MAG: CopG family transcriptional regulator, partial [Bauldia litoralis]
DAERGRGKVEIPAGKPIPVPVQVIPSVAKEISRAAQDRGMSQAMLIEEAWAFYKQRCVN